MLTRSNKLLDSAQKLIYVFALAIVGAFVANFSIPDSAVALTTEFELSEKLSKQLSGSNVPQVLGESTSIPFAPRGWIYPIKALGNCADQASCYAFCEDGANLEICSLVSYRNGMMSAAQLQKALTFANYLQAGYLANCNSLSGCAKLCDDTAAQEECKVLALNIERGARVLGVSDENSITGNQSNILRQCTTVDNCSSSAYESLRAIAQSAKDINALGKVLSVSSEQVNLDTGKDGYLSPPEPVPAPAYQPTDYLGCVVNQGIIASPTGQIVSPEQFDSLNRSVGECDQQFSTTKSRAEDFSASGSQRVTSGISTISDCILSKQSSADIMSCLKLQYY